MSKKFFSIITVVLNSKNNLSETINSLKCQKFKNFEYIVIDGGSSDGTVDIIKNNLDIISFYKSEKDFEYKTHQIAEKNILDNYFDKKEFKKAGGTVSWKFKGKTYSGTLIPSMEDANNRYARTHNGKIKTLPKKKMGGKLRIYKDFVNGVYDNSSSIDFVQSVFDKVNRIYHNQAKEANMSTPNYVMSFLVDG